MLLSGIVFVVLAGVGIVLPILPAYAQGLGASTLQVGPVLSGNIMDVSGIDNIFYAGGILIAVGAGIFIAFTRNISS